MLGSKPEWWILSGEGLHGNSKTPAALAGPDSCSLLSVLRSIQKIRVQEEGDLNRASFRNSSHQEGDIIVNVRLLMLYLQTELKLQSPNKWHLLATA